MGLDLLFLPLLAALVLFFFVKGNTARTIALGVSLVELGLTLFYLLTHPADGAFHNITDLNWIANAGIHFKIGFDGITMLMVLLTNLLMPIIIYSTFNRQFDRPSFFYGLVLMMQTALIGVFTALDGFLFYVFWELALLPIYFICALWGGENRARITLKFFIYTFTGSLFMLLSLIYVYLQTPIPHSFDLQSLYAVQLSPEAAFWVLMGFFFAFAIKMPVFPFHTWQPDTYTVAPMGGTMLLSGIMLKMGVYGMIRWMLPIAPEGWSSASGLFIGLSVISIVYASIIALRQQDFKRLIAYSSIAHVGLISAGTLAFNTQGLQGSLMQMLNHGINVIALFFICDLIEQRTNTRDLDRLGGIARVAPQFAVLFMIVLLGNVAVPLTNGFVGEFLLLSGVYAYSPIWSAFAGLTIIFCAVYMLRVYQLAMFGTISPLAIGFADLSRRELVILGVLCTLILLIGVYPQPIFDLTQASVQSILQQAGAL